MSSSLATLSDVPSCTYSRNFFNPVWIIYKERQGNQRDQGVKRREQQSETAPPGGYTASPLPRRKGSLVWWVTPVTSALGGRDRRVMSSRPA